jgi:hypothetical protein
VMLPPPPPLIHSLKNSDSVTLFSNFLNCARNLEPI